MPYSNPQGYRIKDGTCMKRSDDQLKSDYRNNKQYCKEQGFSPTTSKNTASNTHRKKHKKDKDVPRPVPRKTVRFKSVSPSKKQEGGFRKRKYNKTKKYSKKNKKHNKKHSRKMKKNYYLFK